MALINQLASEIPDHWTYPEAGGQGSFGPYCIASVDLLAQLGTVPSAGRPTGVLLAPETPSDLVGPFLARIDLVVVPFAKFRDGRGFTLARALREHHGFMGDIRALGHVLPDQLPLLVQCGFTSIVVSSDHPVSEWKQIHLAGQGVEAQPKPLLQRLVRRGQQQ